MFDPADFTKPYARPGAVFLYSDAGAAPIRRPDPESVVGTLTPNGDPVTIPESGYYRLAGNLTDTFTVSGPVDRDWDTAVPTDPYRRTPAHAAPDEYTDRLVFSPRYGHNDAVIVTKFGRIPFTTIRRHARGDRDE